MGLSSRYDPAMVPAMGHATVHAILEGLPMDLGLRAGQPMVRPRVLCHRPELYRDLARQEDQPMVPSRGLCLQ